MQLRGKYLKICFNSSTDLLNMDRFLRHIFILDWEVLENQPGTFQFI